MMLIHAVLGLATAIIMSALALKKVEESDTFNSEEDKIMAVLIGCLGGLIYPATIVMGLVYFGAEKVKAKFLDGGENSE